MCQTVANLVFLESWVRCVRTHEDSLLPLACLARASHKIHIVLNSGIPRVLGSLPAHSGRLSVTVSALAYAFTVIKCERGIPRVMPPGLPVTLCYLSHFCICLCSCVALVPPLRALASAAVLPWCFRYAPWSTAAALGPWSTAAALGAPVYGR